MKHSLFSITILLFALASCKEGNGSDINKGISSAKIIKSINKGKPVVIQGMIITDDLDFTQVEKHSVFSSSNRIAEVEVPVTFLQCVFLGKVVTNSVKDKAAITTQFHSNVTFEACDFRGEADFSNSIIDGMVNFTGVLFRENAIFNNITFKSRRTYFTSFSAEKTFSMQEAFIGGSIDFFKGRIKGKATFQSSDFTGITVFSNIECAGKADFSLATFHSNVFFAYAKFSNEFRMSDTRCEGNCDLVSISFADNAWICNSIFKGNVNFSNTDVKNNLNISGTLFATGRPNC